MERTLVLLKPDAVQRRLVGQIVSRFESKGLVIAGLKVLRVAPPLARRMYAEHKGKAFYDGLVEFICSAPIVAMVLEGMEAITVVRGMMGPTFGPDAPPGTIRGDFGLSRRMNLVHGSDSAAAARREIPLFFAKPELVQYPQTQLQSIYASQQGKWL